MKTVIFKTAAEYLLPLLLLFSVFVLLRGHNLPGGGFVGGLLASFAFIIYMLAHGVPAAQRLIIIHPSYFMPIGLSLTLLSGVVAPVFFQNLPVLTVLWGDEPFPVLGLISSALFFDTGVYFVVVGATLTIMFTIAKEGKNLIK